MRDLVIHSGEPEEILLPGRSICSIQGWPGSVVPHGREFVWRESRADAFAREESRSRFAGRTITQAGEGDNQ
jgi:hypothetical protein